MIEIVHGHSLFHTMKKSALNQHKIILLNTRFSIADLNFLDHFKVILSKEIYSEDNEYTFLDEILEIKKSKDIRIWCSKQEADSYLLLMYLCYLLQYDDYHLHVVFSDDCRKDWNSPSILKEEELLEIEKYTHLLTSSEIKEYAQSFEQVKNTKGLMWIMEDGQLKAVDYHYFDSILLEMLAEMKTVKTSALVAKFMRSHVMSDLVITYFILHLIEDGKIKVVTQEENVRLFDCLIEINN